LPKPAILTVDDEPQVLNAIERDLRKHYRDRYRILKAKSGDEAMETIVELRRRDDPVALFLVDQRMPRMSGTEFLTQARDHYPEARKVLLTAYADTEAAIDSINSIGLDYYLLKPWDPPEQHLYPILDDLLGDWAAMAVLPYEGIRVLGHLLTPDSHRVKDFLARNQIPYRWVSLEDDPQGRALWESLPQEERKLPLVFFPDGEYLTQPDNITLAKKAGLTTEPSQPFYDLVIVGAGPAGLAAAVYGASEGLRTVLVEKEGTGGQAGTSARIENYLGFPKGLSGADLARRAVTQARRFGAELLAAQEVTGLRVDDNYRFVQLAGGQEISCHTLIVATGVETRELKVPGAEALTGSSLFYGAAVTEAANFRDRTVFVVGGGNSAGQGAVFLSRYASRVQLLVRGSALTNGMSQYLVDQVEAVDNIEVHTGTEIVGLDGQDQLEAVQVKDRDSGGTRRLEGAAIFVFIGAIPRTEIIGDVLARDRAGFILTGADLVQDGKRPATWTLKRDPFLLETSVPGIFAAGDVRHGSIKRVAAAIGEGSACVQFAHQYLRTV
jgi:thioredoxin reductase (NADPH)